MDVLQELERLGIYNYEIISTNKKKGRYCIHIWGKNVQEHNQLFEGKSETDYLIKWNSRENETAYESLKKEIRVYNWLSETNITPKLVSSNPFFVTKYEKECKTLRAFILSNRESDDFKTIIEAVLKLYVDMLEQLNCCVREDVESVSSTENQIRMFFSKLLLSGPEGTKTKRWEYLKNRVYKYIFWMLRKADIKKYENDSLYILHGDFHLNNELVNESRKVYLIDFENVLYANPNVELAYWYVQVWVLIYKTSELLDELNYQIEKTLQCAFFNKTVFWEIVSLYKEAIIRNSRFHS